jgi:hypothetical protein
MDFCALNLPCGIKLSVFWLIQLKKFNHYVPFLSMNFKERYHFGGKVGSTGPKAPDPLQAIPL